MIKNDKIVIFDLDGTLALIDKRRDLATELTVDRLMAHLLAGGSV